MPTQERSVDRGARRGRELTALLAREVHVARVDRGLSLRVVGGAVGLSEAQVSRIERGLAAGTTIAMWSQLCEVVGLELSTKTFAGGTPLRDRAHAALMSSFRSLLHSSWRWATEVPLPNPGDARAWDALIALGERRYGIEAETSPRDSQALARRLNAKERDGDVDGVIVVVPRTRASREFVAGGAGTLDASFPVAGGRALELLRAGVDPGGSSIVMLDARALRPAR
jgi:transcriptional regulator with XRE-family HTH domain